MSGKIKLVITIAVIALVAAIIGGGKMLANENSKPDMGGKRVLIAYYSYSGNTKAVAEKIQNLTGGDMFEIKPAKDYPANYNDVVALAQQEKAKDVRPELVDNGNVENYDIIFVGTPVWWYTMAGPVKTYLTKNNFDGKVIMPFCTHGGGGESATYTDMQKLAPGAKVLSGYTSYERTAKDDDIKKWINNAKL